MSNVSDLLALGNYAMTRSGLERVMSGLAYERIALTTRPSRLSNITVNCIYMQHNVNLTKLSPASVISGRRQY